MIEFILIAAILCLRYRERLVAVTWQDVDAYLIRKENQHSRWRWGLAVTGLLMLAAFLYVKPSSYCAYMGKWYAALASDPFAFDPANPVPHRILTSLISYLLLLRGHLIIITNLLIAAGLVFTVYWYFRKHAPRPGDALLAATLIALSHVTLSTVYNGGYNDSLTYLLILLMWVCRKRRLLFHGFFFLSLFNRETVVFLLPWFVMISLEDEQRPLKRILEAGAGFAISLAAYAAFRYWLSQQQPVAYDAAHYLRPVLDDPFFVLRMSFNTFGLGLFSVFKVLWILPLAAMVSMWQKGERWKAVEIVVLVACAASQMLFAYDVSRLMTLAFMVLILALLHLSTTNAFEFRRWVGWLALFNMLVPNITVAGEKVRTMHSLLSYVIEHSLR